MNKTQPLYVQRFDYDVIDEQHRDFLRFKERSIKSRTAQTIIENGRDLLEAKGRVGHGNFCNWVAGCFPWTIKTADRMIQVVENIKLDNLSNFENMQSSVLYMLAAPSTPESARSEAIEKAESGESLSVKQAKALINAHKRIESLQAELTSARMSIPDEDVKSRIIDLERKLEAERTKPVIEKIVEVKPPDYDEAIAEKALLSDEKDKLLVKISKMKASQQAEVDGQVSAKLKELEDEFRIKKSQINVLNDRIEYLRESMKLMDKTAGNLYACKKACQKIRSMLIDLSVDLRDLFEDHEITEDTRNELIKLCSDFEQGLTAFKMFLYGNENDKAGEICKI